MNGSQVIGKLPPETALSTPPGSPELTTIVIPFREIGTTGTQRLVERVQKRFGSAQHVLIDCRLRAGTTVGPPPQ